VAETHINEQANYHEDEIDLIELVAKLWKEKWLIIFSTIVAVILGALYAFTYTPVYKISAQLNKPTKSEIVAFNQTDFFSITVDDLFSIFIETLETNDHLNDLATNNADLLESATGIKINENIYNNLSAVRNINYPNTAKKSNDLTPDIYTISYQGINREILNKLIAADLENATKTTIKNINERYKSTLLLLSKKLQANSLLEKNSIDDRLTARKAYVLASRSDRLRELKEALKIAKALNLQSPSSLSRLAESNTSKQVEINSNQDPLYLRGTKLLEAEIENLKNIENDVYLDIEIRKLESQKLLLQSNRQLDLLKDLLDQTALIVKASFYSKNFNSPINPIKPRKTLILVMSIFLGAILGLFIAIGHIIYMNIKTTRPSHRK